METEDVAKHSGLWRITLKGMDFTEGKTTVAKKVFTYNQEVVGQSSEAVTISECGSNFDYAGMSRTVVEAANTNLQYQKEPEDEINSVLPASVPEL